MDLKKMECFEAVSRLKSFTKAAEELHVAQPSITVSISKLEEELGVCLLHRNQRSVELTSEGNVFLERVRRILSDVDNVVNEMQDLGARAKRELKLAIPTSLGSWMFPLIFSEYAVQNPQVILHVSELGVQNILNRIDEEEVELGFGVLNDMVANYATQPLYSGEVLVMLPANHPLCRYEAIPFPKLAEEALILCSGGSYIQERVTKESQKHGISPRIIFTPRQVVTAFNMVASGAGITFVLDDGIAIIRNNPHVAIRRLAEPLTFQTGFIWAKGKYLSVIARDFIQFIKQYKS